ncbi:MAG: phage tail fiber protein [Nocardioidaceae bacterium]
MALTDATLTSLGNSLSTLCTHLSLHSADPGATGASESTASRVAVTWTVDADGDLTAGPCDFAGGAANGPVTHVGLWSAETGGTFRGAFALTGDSAFNSAGEYTVTRVTIDGTSA